MSYWEQINCINGNQRALYEESVCLDICKMFTETKQRRATARENMDDNFEDFVGSTENENQRPCLLTYSQADIQKFPNCSTFLECILYTFTKGESLRTVKEWVCFM